MKLRVFLLSSLLLFSSAHAGKKILLFEDAETLGKGGFQSEHYLSRQEPRTTAYTFTLSYGLLEKVDVGLNLPFEYSNKLESSNISLDLKWNFFEKGETKGAFKFSSELPTKEGAVKYGPTLALQTSFERLSFYAVSSYELKEKVFFQSASVEWKMVENLSLVATGFYLSEDSRTGLVGGLSFSGKNWEFALGVQKILKDKEKPSVVAGFTVRFR